DGIRDRTVTGVQTCALPISRASRMEPFDDLDVLRAALKPLAERRLVVYLTPLGKRGTTLTHGFHAPDELERLRKHHGDALVDARSEERRVGEEGGGRGGGGA